MPELSDTLTRRITRPVVACVVHAVRECGTVRSRAGQHVVLVRRVAKTRNGFAFLVERGCPVEVISNASQIQRVSVKVGQVLRNPLSLGVVPGTGANSVAR